MINETALKTYTELLKTRFREDPGVIYQVKGLKRADLLLECQFAGQIQAFMDVNAVRFLPDGKGLLIGYSSRELPEAQLMAVMQQASLSLLAVITEEELQVVQERAIEQARLIPQGWQGAYCDGAVYHLQVIAIDKALKGTGAFRALLAPLIKDCEAKQEAMVLETFNPDNLPIYEHFGFELVESHQSEAMNLTCYCMVRS